MENNIIRLEDVVQKDMTLDDVEQRIRERPLDRFSLQAWDEMIQETDAMWYTQTQDSIKNLVPFGRMRLNSMLNEMDKEGQLSAAKNQVSIWAERAAAAALSSHKEFDMKVYCPVRELNEEERMSFNGWNLVHFEKTYKFQDGLIYYIMKTNWDFALGDDGQIYHITSGYLYDRGNPGHSSETFFCDVRRAIFFDTCLLRNKNQAYFIAASHGAFLTINHIIENPEVASGDFLTSKRKGNEEYIFNFPLDVNSRSETPLKNIDRLLSAFLPEGISEEEIQSMVEEQKEKRRMQLELQEKERQEKEKRKLEEEKEQKRLIAKQVAEQREREKEREKEWEQERLRQQEENAKCVKQKMKELEQERARLKTELMNLKGIFSNRKRKQIECRLEGIETELEYLKTT